MWVLAEVEKRPTGRSTAVKMKDFSFLQWYLPLDLQ